VISNGFLRSADGSTYTVIEVPGASGTFVQGINNAGVIVGWSVTVGSNGAQHGFVRGADGSTYSMIDMPGIYGGTNAFGINNLEAITGIILVPMASCGARVWTLPVLMCLGAQQTYPQAVDDTGRVAGYYLAVTGGYHGFLAVPSQAGSQPSIRPVRGVISALAFGGFDAIAPGTWIEIYGQNLAKTTREWKSSDFTGNAAQSRLTASASESMAVRLTFRTSARDK